jgi:beta-glucosidase
VTFVDYEHDQKRIPKKSAKTIGQIFERLIEKV